MPKGTVKHGLSRRGCTIPPELHMFYNARARAKKENLPFSIDLSDIVIPAFCPVLGIPLFKGDRKQHWNSPTLDRAVPSLGYIKGNVAVISYRANLLKSDGTATELFKVAAYTLRMEQEHAL